jgi:hypothetical protein
MLSRRDLALLAAGALAARLAHLLFLWASGTGFQIEDSPLYLENADWFARTGMFLTGSLDAPRPETERMYGYIAVVAALQHLTGGGQVAAVLLLQAVADTITVLCVALAAARLGRLSGFVAGALAAVWPNLVMHSGLILADTLALSLMAVAMLNFIRFAETPGWRPALALGVALGASLAIRQGLLPLVPVIALLMAWLAWRAAGTASALPRAIALALIPVLLSGAFLAPQVERHREATGRIVLTSQTGTHLLFWVAAGAASEFEGGTRAEWARRFNAQVAARAEARAVPPDAFQMSDIRIELALEQLAEQPVTGLIRLWVRAGLINLFAPSIAFHPYVRAQKTESFDQQAAASGLIGRVRNFLAGQPAAYLAYVLPAMAAAAVNALFAAAGLIVTLRRYPRMTLVGIGYVAYVLILTGPVIGAKYALPADPVLIVWTAAGLVWAWHRFGRSAA